MEHDNGGGEDLPFSMTVTKSAKDNRTPVYESRLYPGVLFSFQHKRTNKDGSMIYRCSMCSRLEKEVRTRRVVVNTLRSPYFKIMANRWEQDPDYPISHPHICQMDPIEAGKLVREGTINRLNEPELANEDFTEEIEQLKNTEMTLDECLTFIDKMRLPVPERLIKDPQDASEDIANKTGQWLDQTGSSDRSLRQVAAIDYNELDDPGSTDADPIPKQSLKRVNRAVADSLLRKYSRGGHGFGARATANVTSTPNKHRQDLHPLLRGPAPSQTHTHTHHHYNSPQPSRTNVPLDPTAPTDADLRKMKMEVLEMKKQVCEQQIQSANRVQLAAEAIVRLIPQLNQLTQQQPNHLYMPMTMANSTMH